MAGKASGGFRPGLDLPRNVPLLGDGQDVVDHPVQHQTGRNQRKKKVKMIGNSFITRACMGSGGVGLSCC